MKMNPNIATGFNQKATTPFIVLGSDDPHEHQSEAICAPIYLCMNYDKVHNIYKKIIYILSDSTASQYTGPIFLPCGRNIKNVNKRIRESKFLPIYQSAWDFAVS